MVDDPWLPVGFRISDRLSCAAALSGGSDWQLYEDREGGRVLLAKDPLAKRWVDAGLLDSAALSSLSFGAMELRYLSSRPQHALVPVDFASSPMSKAEALSFAQALRRTRQRVREASLHDALLVERFSVMLPVWSVSPSQSDDVVLGRYLTGGVHVSANALRRLSTLLPWLAPGALHDVLVESGLARASATSERPSSDSSSGASAPEGAPGRFSLPGRAHLESFFNEHVIDIVQHPERYRALGIEFPSAVLLHGPPGCGKTFAIEKLVEFLEWPSFSVDSSSIGSPYIHETGKKIAKVFDDALKASPALVVIDEMDAFLSDRQGASGHGQHHVEEVAEFLRRIPEALRNYVLVIGMTNRVEAIDPAILRRGRFDHIIEVGMPSREEVQALVSSLLGSLPLDAAVDPAPLIDALVGRPLSDVSFVVREGARLAARGGRSTLDQKSLMDAARTLPSAQGAKDAGRRIGFGTP